MNHFIAITDHSTDWLQHVLDVSKRLKKQLKDTGRNEPILAGKTLAMIFEKPSLRTRVSFSTGMVQLGGASLMLRGEEMGWGHREEVRDVARVIASMCDGIMARTFEHAKVLELAKWSRVPVLNGLTDYNHPCQAMADFLTIEEHFGKLSGLTIAFIGDGNNVARSLAVLCGKLGVRFLLARPDGYGFPAEFIKNYTTHVGPTPPDELTDAAAAVKKADVIYTDVWTSMGQEAERDDRLRVFAPYQVNAALLKQAPKHAKVLHCLPAHRGEEITDDVIEGPASAVFQQAGNRMHAQKAILEWLLKG